MISSLIFSIAVNASPVPNTDVTHLATEQEPNGYSLSVRRNVRINNQYDVEQSVRRNVRIDFGSDIEQSVRRNVRISDNNSVEKL